MDPSFCTHALESSNIPRIGPIGPQEQPTVLGKTGLEFHLLLIELQSTFGDIFYSFARLIQVFDGIVAANKLCHPCLHFLVLLVVLHHIRSEFDFFWPIGKKIENLIEIKIEIEIEMIERKLNLDLVIYGR